MIFFNDLKTFSSLKELLAILSREHKLITEIFEKRKVLAYKYDDALAVVDYNEDKISALIEFSVLTFYRTVTGRRRDA